MSETSDRYDALRKRIPCILLPNTLLLSQGIAAMGEKLVAQVLEMVRDYDDFPVENDPYGEHDFGAFDFGAKRVFWKIDDFKGTDGYELVLTVMLAAEY